MCEPTTIALVGLGLSAASTVSGYIGAQQQYAAQERQYAENRKAALRNMELGWQQVDNRIIQERDAAYVEKANAARDARAAKSTAQVAAGEAGVSGLSVDALLGDIEGRMARYASGVGTSTDWSVSQLQLEKQGLQATAVDRINSAPRGVRPSLLDAGLRIGGAGLNYAAERERIKRGM